MDILVGILEEGLLYALVSLGVYITYKILDFPDLTVDGSFPLGAAITAILIKAGVHPVLTLFVSFACGMLVGAMTGIIHIKFKVRDLLSGIIMMTALYSINLRIAGRANLPIFSNDTIFSNSFISKYLANIGSFTTITILIIIVLISKLILDFYFTTKSGYLLKAAGDNQSVVTTLAKNCGSIKILALAIANGFVVLAGSVYCQQKGFFEISSGTGTVVIALANVIVGMKLFERSKLVKPTTAVIVGAIVYRACVSIALMIGLPSSDLKLITSLLLLLILMFNKKEKGRLVK